MHIHINHIFLAIDHFLGLCCLHDPARRKRCHRAGGSLRQPPALPRAETRGRRAMAKPKKGSIARTQEGINSKGNIIDPRNTNRL